VRTWHTLDTQLSKRAGTWQPRTSYSPLLHHVLILRTPTRSAQLAMEGPSIPESSGSVCSEAQLYSSKHCNQSLSGISPIPINSTTGPGRHDRRMVETQAPSPLIFWPPSLCPFARSCIWRHHRWSPIPSGHHPIAHPVPL